MHVVRMLCLLLIATFSVAGNVSAQEFRVATQNIWKGLTEFHDLNAGMGGQCFSQTGDDSRVCVSACVESNVLSLTDHFHDVLGDGAALDATTFDAQAGAMKALVGLQEVHHGVPQSCALDQPGRLAGDLGPDWNGIFGAARPYYGGEFGNGIMHNVDAQSDYTLPYRNTSPGGEARALTVALLDFGNAKRVWFGSTHLDNKVRKVALLQAQEARDWMQFLAAIAPAPAILVGDFNLGREQTGECPGFRDCEAALIARMSTGGAFTEVSGDTAVSYLNFVGDDVHERHKVDYIFVHDPGRELEIVRRHVVHYHALGAPVVVPVVSRSYLPCTNGRCPADHKTVVADFRFR